jgi:uncharacterized protein (DUF433 family)
MENFKHINHDSEIMGGKACIRGTRVTVGMIVTQISEGKTEEDLLLEYPYLTKEGIVQALKYAAWAVDAKEMEIVSA